jgi:hypothetical protein
MVEKLKQNYLYIIYAIAMVALVIGVMITNR